MNQQGSLHGVSHANGGPFEIRSIDESTGSLHGVSHANGGPFEIRSIDESTGELAWRITC